MAIQLFLSPHWLKLTLRVPNKLSLTSLLVLHWHATRVLALCTAFCFKFASARNVCTLTHDVLVAICFPRLQGVCRPIQLIQFNYARMEVKKEDPFLRQASCRQDRACDVILDLTQDSDDSFDNCLLHRWEFSIVFLDQVRTIVVCSWTWELIGRSCKLFRILMGQVKALEQHKLVSFRKWSAKPNDAPVCKVQGVVWKFAEPFWLKKLMVELSIVQYESDLEQICSFEQRCCHSSIDSVNCNYSRLNTVHHNNSRLGLKVWASISGALQIV